MTDFLPPDLERLIAERLASGGSGSEGDLLCEALQALSLEDADLQSIQDALAEWKAGDRGVSLSEALAAVRRRR